MKDRKGSNAMKIVLKELILSALLIWPSMPVLAGETFRLKVGLSQAPVAGEEVVVTVEAQDQDRNLVESDSRQLNMIVADSVNVATQKIQLENGKASIKLTFNQLGANLIKTFDPINPALIGYKAFEVSEKKGDLK